MHIPCESVTIDVVSSPRDDALIFQWWNGQRDMRDGVETEKIGGLEGFRLPTLENKLNLYFILCGSSPVLSYNLKYMYARSS